MTQISVVHLGHSHLAAMIPCLHDRPIDQGGSENDITHFVFNTGAHNIFGLGEERFAYGVDIDGEYRLNPAIAQMIHEAVPPDSTVVISTMLGGNSHNALTLLERPEGLDIVLPDQPCLPLVEKAQVIPYAVMRSALSDQCTIFLNDLRGIRSATSGRVFHVLSPPPIEDDAYLATVIDRDPYFAKAGLTRVTPASVRYKIWLLHCSIYIDTCAEIGVEVLPLPPKSVIDGKWLSPDCVGPDPTHGNLTYGLRILRQIETVLDGRYAGWRWIG
jgi:hypothetical protein